MTTRINYNQGQVSASFSSMTLLRSALANHGAAYAERQNHQTGEWFPCNPTNGAFLDMTAPENKEHPAKL